MLAASDGRTVERLVMVIVRSSRGECVILDSESITPVTHTPSCHAQNSTHLFSAVCRRQARLNWSRAGGSTFVTKPDRQLA